VPTITSVTPTTAAPGCEVTIVGTNFQTVANGGPVTKVAFGTTNGTGLHIDADTQLEVTIPGTVSASASHPVVATNSSGDSASFAYSTGAAGTCPGVPTFSPTSGLVGSTVTISGSFTTAPTAVRFNTSSLVTPTTTSATSVTAVVPSSATTGPIHVYTTAGERTSATSFTIPAPTITSFTPAFGPVGKSIAITGTNFTGATSVKFNGVTATFVVNSATSITATVPATATTGKITVTTPGGTATSATNFTVSTIHSRSVSLSLRKHLVARGKVSVSDAFTACFASVKVTIQHRSSGHWKNVKSTTTSSSGAYKVRLKDVPGKYRARLKRLVLSSGADLCLKDTSPTRTN
jgi:hypothetical protein